MASVRLEKLEKRYGKIQTIHGIDLDIKHGEFVVFVGPSGCGKSTLLRMIAGLEEISGGKISIGDQVVNDIQPKDRGVAMVFQQYALYPHMNVFDNMAFPLKLAKKPKSEIEKKVREAAEMLELTPLLDRKPAAMSGGQRQRVAMGRAIVHDAKVYAFDEPLSNLDAQLRTQMRIEIKKLHMRMETTSLYVTHDQVEAMTLADRIVILKDGYVMQVGSPVEVYEHPVNKFVGTFIGNPPMNIVPARVRAVGDGLQIVANQLHLPVPDKPGHQLKPDMDILLGIRPDDISVAEEDDGIPEEWKFKGKVLIAETLGGESLLDISVGGTEMMAEIAGRYLPKPGEKMAYAFNLKHMHAFDVKTEKTIY